MYVHVCSDERLVGYALVALLNRSPAIDARYGGRLTASVSLLGPGARTVLLWFGDCADAELLGTIRALRATRPHVPICVVASRVDSEALEHLVASDARGLGVVLRDEVNDPVELIRAVLQLLSGGTALTPRVLEQVIAQARAPDDALDRLSADERSVLAMVAYGYRNGEIARRLDRSEKSVERRVTRIFTKLSLNRDPDGAVGGRGVLDRRVVAARLYLQHPR